MRTTTFLPSFFLSHFLDFKKYSAKCVSHSHLNIRAVLTPTHMYITTSHLSLLFLLRLQAKLRKPSKLKKDMRKELELKVLHHFDIGQLMPEIMHGDEDEVVRRVVTFLSTKF